MGTRYTICRWAINRSDPQNLLSVTLDVPLHSASSAFPFSYSLVPLSPLPWTPATTIVLYWSPDSLFQPASLMPPQSSGYLFSTLGAHSISPTSSKPPPSTSRLFVVSFSLLLISRPSLP